MFHAKLRLLKDSSSLEVSKPGFDTDFILSSLGSQPLRRLIVIMRSEKMFLHFIPCAFGEIIIPDFLPLNSLGIFTGFNRIFIRLCM